MPIADTPLDEIFASANSLRSAGLIVEYSLGGALAAIQYTEPFTTYDADILREAVRDALPIMFKGVPGL